MVNQVTRVRTLARIHEDEARELGDPRKGWILPVSVDRGLEWYLRHEWKARYERRERLQPLFAGILPLKPTRL